MLKPLGDQIRIDAIRELHHDLHMRPFEADRRVYLVFGADTLNEEAADALLKDLEEPPPYAVAVLVADDLGPLPDTIRSRCQLVPFRRLAEATVRDEIVARSPELSEHEATALARVAAGGSTGSPPARPGGGAAARRGARRGALGLPRSRLPARRCVSAPDGDRRRAGRGGKGAGAGGERGARPDEP